MPFVVASPAWLIGDVSGATADSRGLGRSGHASDAMPPLVPWEGRKLIFLAGAMHLTTSDAHV